MPAEATLENARPVTEDLRDLEQQGLDRLQSEQRASAPRTRQLLTKALPPVVLLAALLAFWQLYVVIAQPRPDIIPGPAQVLAAFGDAWSHGRLQEAVLTSLERGVIGFGIAVIVGSVRWV